jgi:uncharacterized protein (TIGR03437 family)
MRASLLFLAFSALGFAQPYINYRGIVNVASYMAPGLPAGSLPRGGMVAIFGRNLGPTAGAQAATFPLSATLSGVSITITQKTTVVNALPVYVGAGQINAIIPSNAPLGRVTLQVTVNNVAGNPSPANIVAASFGAFAVNSGGFGPGIIQNFTPTSLDINSTQLTAKPGQVEILWGTGLGAVAADNVAPTTGNLPVQAEVFVGGQPASLSYFGRTSCCAGIDQINFTVPAAAPAGCYVPVVVRLNGTIVSNTVTMSIDPNGAPCTDPANPLAAMFRTGGKFGAAMLSHESLTATGGGTTQSYTADEATLSLRQETGGQWAFDPYVSLPPLGTCAAYGIAGIYPSVNDLPGAAASVKDLNGGTAASVTGPAGTVSLPQSGTNPNYYTGLLATSVNVTGIASTYLTSGSSSTLSVPGGTDVGQFQATVPAGPTFAWTNQTALTTVTRANGFTVTWTNPPSGATAVSIIGYNADMANNASGGFQCMADPAAGSFTVPAVVMGNMPATPATGTLLGGVVVGAATLGAPVSFTATGLDKGIALFANSTRQTVIFQ